MRLARRARAAVRHLLLAATFGALVVLVFAADILPPLIIEVPAAGAPAPFNSSSPSGRISGTWMPSLPGAAVPAVASTWDIGRQMPAVIWVGGAVLLLGSLAAALLRLHGIRRRGLPCPERAALIQELTTDLNIRPTVSVVLHEDVAAPLTCDVRQPTILLPLDARGRLGLRAAGR